MLLLETNTKCKMDWLILDSKTWDCQNWIILTQIKLDFRYKQKAKMFYHEIHIELV